MRAKVAPVIRKIKIRVTINNCANEKKSNVKKRTNGLFFLNKMQ